VAGGGCSPRCRLHWLEESYEKWLVQSEKDIFQVRHERIHSAMAPPDKEFGETTAKVNTHRTAVRSAGLGGDLQCQPPWLEESYAGWRTQAERVIAPVPPYHLSE